MTTEFSHRIIELPLFLGLSQSEITAIMGHTRFGFTQVAEGMPVVKEHDACFHLYFLRKGTLRVETVADDHGYRLVEEVGALPCSNLSICLDCTSTIPAPSQPRPTVSLSHWRNRR